jgi:4-amino-4-deoxy-L-arabinose transferase-like glycosyltransferase
MGKGSEMASFDAEQSLGQEVHSRTDMAVLLGIAAIEVVVHLFTNNRYGFHRDELQFLSDARHLDWGFVPYPPLTPFVEHVSLGIFGVSMVGLRMFSVLAQALAIVVTGLMARELGGGRLAQVTAALAAALAPLPLFEGTEFQYTTFDYLWWVLAGYFVVRLLKTENPCWWLAIGSAMGFGLMTKYTILFYVAGILGGLLLTRDRRFFLSGWLWGGVGLALLIFLPNLVWQIRHGFVTYHFLQHIHLRDVGEGRANGFVLNQFLICTNLCSAPPVDCGLVVLLAQPALSSAGLDVPGPAGAVLFWQGTVLLPGGGLSHADCDGRGCRRALGREADAAEAGVGGRRAIHRNRWRWDVRLRAGSAARLRRSAYAFRSREKRRSARGVRVV